MADLEHTASTVLGDVEQLARYFQNKYNTLEKAFAEFDPNLDWNIQSFISELKRWDVQVSDPYELFAHIDADFSGKVSWNELFEVLSLPVAEVREREQRRQEAEVTRIYEEFANKIHDDFGGSVEMAFKAVGVTEGKEISVAGFRRLLAKLHMELDAGVVDRVFRRIDENKSDAVSIEELKKALGAYLVRGDLVDLANYLVERDGSIAAAFEVKRGGGLLERQVSGLPPTLPTSPTHQNALAGGYFKGDRVIATNMGPNGVTIGDNGLVHGPHGSDPLWIIIDFGRNKGEVPMLPENLRKAPMVRDDFLKLLRRLRVLGEGGEAVLPSERAIFVFDQCMFSSIDEVRQLLEQLYKEEEQQKQDLERQKSRAEQMKKQRAFIEYNGGIFARRGPAQRDAANRIRGRVETWTSEAGKLAHEGGLPRPEGVTQGWEMDARKGASKDQLQDYLAMMQEIMQQRNSNLQDLQAEINGIESPQMSTPISPTTPGSFMMSGGRLQLQRTSSQLVFEKTSRQQQAAVKSKQLIQAAAAGDVAKLKRLLQQNTDVNISGWGGATPLMAASRHGREAAVQVLLACRADLGRTDEYGRTAVDHAQHAGSRKSSVTSWLRGYGGLSGKELRAKVDAVARQIWDVETQFARLNEYKAKLPSKDDLNYHKQLLEFDTKRKRSAMLRRSSDTQITPKASTPRSSPDPGTPRNIDDGTPSFSLAGFVNSMGNLPRPPFPGAGYNGAGYNGVGYSGAGYNGAGYGTPPLPLGAGTPPLSLPGIATRW